MSDLPPFGAWLKAATEAPTHEDGDAYVHTYEWDDGFRSYAPPTREAAARGRRPSPALVLPSLGTAFCPGVSLPQQPPTGRDPVARAPIDQWWTINGAEMMQALIACHNGEDPEIVYLELYANSDATDHGDR